MKRELILGMLIVAGGLAIAAAAQQAPAPAPSAAAIEVDKLRDNLFVLRGGGGNTAVFVQANGVTVVDTKNPGWGQPLLDEDPGAHEQAGDDDHQHAYARRSCERQRRLSRHRRHRRAGEHRGNMKKMATVTDANRRRTSSRRAAASGSPKRTFRDTMTLGSGNDRIDLYYFGRGHTDGDAWVLFPALRVLPPATSSRARTSRSSTTTTAAAAWRSRTRS